MTADAPAGSAASPAGAAGNAGASGIGRFAVVGNPIAHSWSPAIHQAFGRACGLSLSYERLLAPIDPAGEFERQVQAFFAAGGRGMNVTVPFKERAFRLAVRVSAAAAAAGACNTLMPSATGDGAAGAVFGDNTDGSGLVRDIEGRLGLSLAGQHLLLLGAGGAARGVVLPLVDRGVASLTVANRSLERAQRLLADLGPFRIPAAAVALEQLAGDRPAVPRRFDLVIDATAAGLGEPLVELSPAVFDGCRLAYDMVYGPQPTGFLRQASAAGVALLSDGLGMLVEQAAGSFALWHGIQPQTAAVHADLRRRIDGREHP